MVKDKGRLSHHESLRYDYLSKNVHYLNDKEQAELAFLEAKMKTDKSELNQLVRKSKSEKASPKQRIQGKSDIAAQPKTTKSASPSRKWTDGKEPTARGDVRKLDTSKITSTTPSRLNKKKKQPKLVDLANLRENKQAKREAEKDAARKKREQTQILQRASLEGQKKSGRLKRAFKWVGIILLVTVLVMVGFFVKGVYDAKQQIDSTVANSEVFNGAETRDGVNILIMGTDVRSGANTDGESRSDSIMVMNINNSDGTIKLISFMRDTLVNIPGYSETDDFGTIYYDYKLNAAFALGEADEGQGAEYVRQVLKANFDLDIKYYAMIDFKSFVDVVETLYPGGVEIDAQFATVDGVEIDTAQVPNDTGLGTPGNYYPIKVGTQMMDGETLLNYARYRSDDEYDNGRTKRQQQVIHALILQALTPRTLFTGSEALGEIYGMTSTNIPISFILTNGMSIATSAKNGFNNETIPAFEDWEEDYDKDGGLGLFIDFEKYQERLAELGFR